MPSATSALSWTSPLITVAPSATSRSASAAPWPRAPPVTRATLPVKRRCSGIWSDFLDWFRRRVDARVIGPHDGVAERRPARPVGAVTGRPDAVARAVEAGDRLLVAVDDL